MGVRSRPGKGSAKPADKGKARTEATPEPPAPVSRLLWGKVLDKTYELTPQEVLNASHWLRQTIAVAFGTVFGVLQLTGAPCIMTFILAGAMVPPVLLSITNEIDAEEISAVGSIQTEGMMPAFALFLLSWILSYTVCLPPASS